jgi:YidC/Oxa1 family membrane protein insertase
MLYPYIGAANNGALLARVAPITKPKTQLMQQYAREGKQEQVMQIRGELQAINRRAGIKLWKSAVPLLQVFIGFGTFRLFKAMGALPVPGWLDGGALWFQNLAVPDPYFLMPILTAGVLHWVLRAGLPLFPHSSISANIPYRKEVKLVPPPPPQACSKRWHTVSQP